MQKSSVKEISFRPQINGHNQTSIHIPAQLLEEKPKDGMYNYKQSLLTAMPLL